MKNVLVVIAVGTLWGGAALVAGDQAMTGCPMQPAPAAPAEHQMDSTHAMQDCPMSAAHAGAVDKRGDEAMGFDHNLTQHHFLLRADGGVIEVIAGKADDTASINAIRQHLGHVATMFAEGNFDIPMLIHDQVPPGVPVMKEMKEVIHYRFEEEARGGRIVISSDQPKAVAALHDFLKFQIDEHGTGDPLDVTP